MSAVELHYDLQEFVKEKGTLADKLRLVAAGYRITDDERVTIIERLESILNEDGGVPFDLDVGNPSSVKETAEILALVSKFRKEHESLVRKLTSFLVSRQKGNGGFAETLNLDPFIEDKWGESLGREFYPVGKSITWLTGKALEALCLVKYEDEERLKRARDYLVGLQYEDGHWPDFEGQEVSDPLATGNILPALKAVGVNDDSKVYEDGRAALFQHLKTSVERDWQYDMVDLSAVGRPISDKETEVIRRGVELVVQTQSEDGGWSHAGTKKSDPELSSILGYVVQHCGKF
ncbi:MAG: terpene cyclase/mutase family protein [Candidatus Thorarchaeota archaeon]|nr:MAG: terpene cyclase/mutase family protein [Candidatus Thorarchaeota archaeon]